MATACQRDIDVDIEIDVDAPVRHGGSVARIRIVDTDGVGWTVPSTHTRADVR